MRRILYSLAILAIFEFLFIIALLSMKNEKVVFVCDENKSKLQCSQAEREFYLIKAPCKDCLSFKPLIAQAKVFDFNVYEFDFNDKKAKELIRKYKITRLPALIIKGKKLNTKDFNRFFVKISDAWVYKAYKLPYFSLDENRILGLVNVKIIEDKNCKVCANQLLMPELKTLFSLVHIASIEHIDANSKEAKEMIEKYYIDSLPCIILSKEIADYNKSLYSNLGVFTSDGSFIIKKKLAPYFDLKANKLRGLLRIAIVTASRCWACKSAKQLLNYLNSLGLRFYSIEVHDFNSAIGKAMIKDYEMRYLPSAIIIGDTKVYEIFKKWYKIGRIYKNGVYAIDAYPLLGPGYYFSTKDNNIIFMK